MKYHQTLHHDTLVTFRSRFLFLAVIHFFVSLLGELSLGSRKHPIVGKLLFFIILIPLVDKVVFMWNKSGITSDS